MLKEIFAFFLGFTFSFFFLIKKKFKKAHYTSLPAFHIGFEGS